ncbi:enoyl-CoA hydratase/isomerase family protein [Burkholderia sp. BCC1977]|uniref:enoyl-CoA hydratase/isomerase family protein n=1 Tax=Burkholderia sp. BCC1977 TaxID=2817440 RepID=UPI002ABD3072|nr:enoyl-CoA hydratase-related protein [Burkholderia sp. BCC1977]
MHESHLNVRFDGQVARVLLNRPERMNALDAALIAALQDFFSNLRDREDIRVVVLEGEGRIFCAGLDLKDAQSTTRRMSVGEGLMFQRRLRDVMLAMRRCPQPIIGIIDGAASGAGMALALSCDIRLATDSMRMNAAFVRLGASGCDMGVSYFLPRMVGSSVAAELLLTGRFLEAGRAYQLGLVSAVGTREAMRDEAKRFIDEMLRTSPLGLRLTKEALGHAVDAACLEAAIAMEDRNQILCLQGEDFEEGITAFLEKRSPRYTGR